MNKIWIIGCSIAASAVLAVGTYFVMHDRAKSCSASVVSGEAAIGGPFTLINQFGETVTDQDVFQNLSLVYFGFTFCPDICSIDVARNVSAVELADEMGVEIQPVFITFDPQRDTPEALGDYAQAYHPRMLGLTGSEEQVATAAKAYRVFYQRQGGDEDYVFNHSSISYLVGPDGFVEFFRRDQSPDDVAAAMACFASN